MSGNPAFQASAFQNNAFQAGVSLVGATYSLGSPAFATPALHAKHALTVAASYTLGAPVFPTPALTWRNPVNPYTLGSPSFATPAFSIKYALTVATYSLGSPVFAKPVLTSVSTFTPLHANPYSLGSPVFPLPAMGRRLALNPRALTLGSPVFATQSITINYHFLSNVMALQPPDFRSPNFNNNWKLQVVFPFWLGSPSSAPAPIIITTELMRANDYWLDNPRPGYPRLQWQITAPEVLIPPFYYTQLQDAANLLRGLCDHLMASLPPGPDAPVDTARMLIATLRGNAEEEIRDDTLGTDLEAIYLACDAAGASYAGIEATRQFLMTQVASRSVFTQVIYRCALVMTLGLETKIVTRMTFTTQNEINNMGGAIINHLAKTELQLPRFMTYRTGLRMPSLYLANRIYADASRAEEICAENDVVHPAFVPQTIRALSDVGR